jgi:hypothetical protein
MSRVLHVLEDNGQEGLATQFRNFKIRWQTREEDKKTYDDRLERKLNLVLAAVLVIVTALGVWVTIRTANHQSILDGNSQMYDADSNIK